MPLFEYKCEKCGVIEEHLVRHGESEPVKCEKCGVESLKKIISQNSFALKGQGWYATDYKKPEAPKKED